MRKNVLLHLLVLIGGLSIIVFGSFILPFIYWMLNRRKSGDLFDIQATNLLNFQLLFSVVFFVLAVVFWLCQIAQLRNDMPINSFYLMLFAITAIIVNVIYPVFVAIKIYKGSQKLYYPKLIRIIK